MASLQKNVASQNFTFCMVSASTGAADASATVTVKVTKDNGTQASGGGTVTNSGNGQYNYAPTQAETNATDVGFLMTATGDIPVNYDFHTDQVDGNGLLKVDTEDWKGTAVSSPATGGIPDVNAKNINNVSTISVANINANVGTTQPINFTGTAGSALVQSDVTDWKAATAPAMTGDAFARLGAPAGASTSADIAALKTDLDAGVNVAQINGSATAAVALNNSTNSMCYGTCSGGTTTTAVVSTLNNPSSLTSSGQLIGRTIIFLGSTGTGGLQAQASNITASTTGVTPTITFTAVTNAPAAADKFIVV